MSNPIKKVAVPPLDEAVLASSEEATACRDLVTRFYGAIDAGRATEGISVVDDYAVFVMHGTEFNGREEVLRFLADREARTDRHTVHLIANDAVYRTGDDGVTQQATLILYARVGDEYAVQGAFAVEHGARRGPSGWRLTARRASALHG